MHVDATLSEPLLDRRFPGSGLTAAGDGVTVGPLLLGVSKPAHVLTPTSTVRGIVNMTALTAVAAATTAR